MQYYLTEFLTALLRRASAGDGVNWSDGVTLGLEDEPGAPPPAPEPPGRPRDRLRPWARTLFITPHPKRPILF